MTATARKLNHSPQPAANEQAVSAQASINHVRQLLGKCSIASRFDKLSDQQKAMVLYGAKLRPSSLLRVPFETMTEDEREAIRQSLIALQDAAAVFKGLPMGKADVNPVKSKPRQVYPVPQPKAENFEELSQLAAELTGLAAGVRKQ